MFDITNGTIKLLYPRISPDGKWLSYRGTDNSSVWLMNLENQENRLLMNGSNARSVIWLDDARLVASLTDENGSYHLVVVDINDCGISRVDGIQTELMDAILVK
jgi:Tol biopolymer transport system component